MLSEQNQSTPRITLHMVSSIDGFIARRDNDVSWLNNTGAYDAGISISDEEAAAFVKTIDCYVLGSHTYEHALQLGWPYGDTPTIVVTSRQLPSSRKSVEFYSGDLRTLVSEKLASRFQNVWLAGGAILGQHFLTLGLIDEIRMMIAPVMLGDGLRMFGSLEQQTWELKNVTAYKNAFVELRYTRIS